MNEMIQALLSIKHKLHWQLTDRERKALINAACVLEAADSLAASYAIMEHDMGVGEDEVLL